jgi:hypothetical protein
LVYILGVGEHLGWNYADLLTNLARLRDHPGFPSGEQVMCPVFQQDKYSYLEALLPFKLIIPTLKVNCTPWEKILILCIMLSKLRIGCLDGESCVLNIDEVAAFLGTYSEGAGWVVKLPFTTNSHGRHFCLTIGKL